jgi:hypothetical protein
VSTIQISGLARFPHLPDCFCGSAYTLTSTMVRVIEF